MPAAISFSGEQDHIIEHVTDHRESEPVINTDPAAKRIRQTFTFFDKNRLASIKAGTHGGAAIHRNTDDLRGRTFGLDRRRNT